MDQQASENRNPAPHAKEPFPPKSTVTAAKASAPAPPPDPTKYPNHTQAVSEELQE